MFKPHKSTLHLTVDGASDTTITGKKMYVDIGGNGDPKGPFDCINIHTLEPGAPLVMENATEPERKPFDLEAAKAGAPLVTRDGRKARFVAHVPEALMAHCRLIVLIDGKIDTYFSDGLRCTYETDADLFMAPKPKRTVWLNFYRNDGYSAGVKSAAFATKEMALFYSFGTDVVAVAVPVEVEV